MTKLHDNIPVSEKLAYWHLRMLQILSIYLTVKIKRWINDFEDTAELCGWNDIQKTILPESYFGDRRDYLWSTRYNQNHRRTSSLL